MKKQKNAPVEAEESLFLYLNTTSLKMLWSGDMDPCIHRQEIYEGDWSAVRPGLFLIRYLLGSGLNGLLSRYENRGDKNVLGVPANEDAPKVP